MENSTKALLIAASVLIVIVLISVGIRILGSTSEVTDQVDTVSGTMASSVFNSQFSSYFDTSTSGTQARSLVSKIISNNSKVSSSNSFSADKHQIYLNFTPLSGSSSNHKWKTADLQNIYQSISNTSNYELRVSTACTLYNGGYYNGYIICISITEIN